MIRQRERAQARHAATLFGYLRLSRPVRLKPRESRAVSIALGSASQIAMFVAPVLVLLSYVIGPSPMSLQFWPGAVAMMLITTQTAYAVMSGGRSAWFLGVLVVNANLVLAIALYLLPPRIQ